LPRLADDVEPTAEKPLHDALSDRELEVFRMIAAGMTATQIAEELFLSVKTISTYRSRILEKMNMKTNAELMHYAIKNNMFD
jgi:two-component system, NarL family, invasion response regulator UvrY